MARRISAALAAACALGGAAHADEAALAEFRAAVAKAEAHAAERYAFTLDFQDLGDEKGRVFRVRFDPRKPPGARWSAVDPPSDQYGKEERAAFERLTKDDEADGALIYEGLAAGVAGATVVAADAVRATIAFPLNGPDMSQETKDALAASAVLNRASGHLESVEVRSLRPFKPSAAAKIKSMRQLQRFEILSPGGPALMVASESDTEGSALFKSFSSKARLSYSSIEKVGAPARAPAK